jgi:hypothetical protein
LYAGALASCARACGAARAAKTRRTKRRARARRAEFVICGRLRWNLKATLVRETFARDYLTYYSPRVKSFA